MENKWSFSNKNKWKTETFFSFFHAAKKWHYFKELSEWYGRGETSINDGQICSSPLRTQFKELRLFCRMAAKFLKNNIQLHIGELADVVPRLPNYIIVMGLKQGEAPVLPATPSFSNLAGQSEWL